MYAQVAHHGVIRNLALTAIIGLAFSPADLSATDKGAQQGFEVQQNDNSIQSPQLTISPGDDLWQTPPGQGSTFRHFLADPIPADFFGPGSDPFTGEIELMGQPLQTNPPGVLGPTDMVIRRPVLFDIPDVPDPNSSSTIPIEIVALHLQSVQPIQVTFNGGISTQQWMVDLTLSPSVIQPQGTMEVIRNCDDGGTFNSELPVIPLLIFTRTDIPTEIVQLDLASSPPIVLNGAQGGWSLREIPPFQIQPIPPGTMVDHDVNPSTPDIPVLPSNFDFFSGLLPLECVPDIGPSICQGVRINRLEAWETVINCVPPLASSPLVMGAVCLSDGGCVMTEVACADAIAGATYLGDGTICQPFACGLPPLPGILFQQVDFLFDSLNLPDSRHGRVVIDPDPALFPLAFGIDSGFVNIFTDRGWVVQNLWLNFNDGVGEIATYFDLSPFDGHDITQLSAFVNFSPVPLPSFIDGPRSSYPVGIWGYNAEGAWLDGLDTNFVKFAGIPFEPGSMPFLGFGSERHTQPNKSNIQTAKNQCVPASVANSLQYLEDRYGLPIPNPHLAGLSGDTTLVGRLDSLMQRPGVRSRDTGRGAITPPFPGQRGMVAGKFAYLKANGLERKLIQKHQGNRAGTGGLTPAGDFTASGIKTKDESVNGKVTFDWICDQIKKGEDVEVIFGHYNGANRHGGHAIRIFECGKTLGVPWLGYVHDALQTHKDATDTKGLECVRAYVVDVDNDSLLHIGAKGKKIEFAFSESADNDMDSIPQGIDNAPNHWNPGQEDIDGNGIGDAAESPFLDENTIGPIEFIPAGGSFASTFFVNSKPAILPDHKDIWFVGRAMNVSPDTALVSVSFEIKVGAFTVTPGFGGTTEIPPGAQREIFGAGRLDICPDSVRVIIKSDVADIVNVSGTLSHICYQGSVLGCCVFPGDYDHNGAFNIADVTAGIARIFSGGPAPFCNDEADADGNNTFNIADVTYGIARIFSGGPAPICGTTGT